MAPTEIHLHAGPREDRRRTDRGNLTTWHDGKESFRAVTNKVSTGEDQSGGLEVGVTSSV